MPGALLAARLPACREHVLVNRAIPASTAFLFATCLSHHVPPDADLVTLEFTVRSQAAFKSATCV